MATIVRLLGEAQVLTGGRRHDPRVDKRLGLLGYLACQGRWAEREKLAFLFWPDASRDQARTNLRGLLARCKELPWSGDLEAEPTRLRWRVECDVRDFKRAIADGAWADAVSRYSGDLLAGADLDDAGEFAAWVERERVNLEESYRAAVLRRVGELEGAGRLAEAVELLEARLRRDPLDEDAALHTLRLLGTVGDRDRALRLYADFTRRLADELGLRPTAALERLARSIETEPPGAAAAAPASAAPTAASRPGRGSEQTRPPTLPAPLTPFVGREVELAELMRLLSEPDRRLVTIVGTGGVGKTRLALQVARRRHRALADGAHFVPLDSVTAVDAVPARIAAVLGLDLRGRSDPLTQVIRALESRETLLVLDNFEQLRAGSDLVLELLRRCPRLGLLATSREALNLAGEWLFPIEGLRFPRSDERRRGALEAADEFDAVRFFVQRCEQVQPSFALSEDAVADVVDICRTVDGLPLALELAAAWVRVLPLAEIAGEIRRSLDLLRRDAGDLPARHRSIRSAFEHSWRLLTRREQEVLGRLSVFRNGFRREAAAYVAGASIVILAALVDKSLLRVSANGRYDRHPLLHQYTSERLAQDPDLERESRTRHLAYFSALAEEVAVRHGPHVVDGLRRLEEEQDNVRAALEYAEASGAAEAGLQVLVSLTPFFRNHLAEGREWHGRLLALPTARAAPTRAGALVQAGALALLQGDYAEARTLSEAGLELARTVPDSGPVVVALGNIGLIAKIQGDYAAARSGLLEHLATAKGERYEVQRAFAHNNLGDIARAHGELDEAESAHGLALDLGRKHGDARTIAQALNGLGRVALDRGDHELARRRFEESLARAQAASNAPGVAASLDCLGRVAEATGDPGAARAPYAKALRVKWESGSELYVAISLEGHAAAALGEGHARRAARLLGAAEAIREARSTPLPPDERVRNERHAGAARARLGEGPFEAAWREGRTMRVAEAVEHALGGDEG